jgi:hypothetical protein
MKKYPFIAALLIASTMLVATTCDNCKNLDCLVPPFDYLEFSYVNTGGEDLLDQKYEPSDIKVFSLDEHENRVDAVLYFIEGNPTVVHAQLTRDIDRAFLEVKGEVTDTLDFEFRYHKTECCGTTSEIIKVTIVDEEFTGEVPIQILGE